MPRYQPPLPPRVVQRLPDDPFDHWLARQAAMGHDKHWLRHNKEGLRKRWESSPEDLPLPKPREPKIGDRYDEL